MTLSNEERDKFAAYLEQLITDNEALIIEASKSIPGVIATPLLRLKVEATSARIIADRLRAAGSMRVHPPDDQSPPATQDNAGAMPPGWKPGRCV